ncbi:hypothetical protein FNF29_01465 [Cafeteria roenbergensis]|uniref:Uncharacterized protein n=1 Tax=Cafeteria roenbergensis TaxID=33653 RepID=A0A5A8CU92_CAFRO|nr:hypothetical protein FNF29_01465 [Cafeteria roenbergensis]|eukprot:KAA0156047.1 hypothetical protein FNF29_01465 [Cafeteria roenbergensis]
MEAIRRSLVRLVQAMRLPAGAEVRVDFQFGTSSSGRLLRRMQSTSSAATSAVASLAIDLNQAAASNSSSGADVTAATSLASTVSAQLGSTASTVSSAVQTAIIEADPAAAEGGVTMDSDTYFAVIAASDGAVIGASSSVLAASTPSPSPSPATQAIPLAGLRTNVAAWVLGGIVIAIVVVGTSAILLRRTCGASRVASEEHPDRT